MITKHWHQLTFSQSPPKHYPDRTSADLDQTSDKGIPTPTAGRRGHLKEMEKGVPVGTSLLPQPCGRKRRFRVGDFVLLHEEVRLSYVEKGSGRRVETRPKWENELSPHSGWRGLAQPVQPVIPLEVYQSGKNVENDKL